MDFRAGSLPLVVYVDVDDTLVRWAGSKRVPVVGVIGHVRALFAEGARLYCWSTGGGEYAREVARELGIEECFVGFLPKPQVMVDDQLVSEWRRLVQVHPGGCEGETVAGYWGRVGGEEGTA